MSLLDAITARDPAALKRLLNAGDDPDQLDESGTPVLIHAADTGEVAYVQHMLDAGADIEARDNIGWTALMAAISAGSSWLVEHLLRAGANVNHVAREDTPLTCAVTDARPNVVAILLENGADPDLRRPDGWTPLMLAAYRGEPEIVEALLTQGADATVTLGPRLMDAAMVAAANQHRELALSLVEVADASQPEPDELWSAVRAWCEQKAPELVEHFQTVEVDTAMPEAWAEAPEDIKHQLTHWKSGLPFYDYRGLDLDDAIAVAEEMNARAEKGEFVGRSQSRLATDEPVRRRHWSEGWLPVARDDSGNMLLCDLDPRDNGLPGQFVSWSVEHGPISVLASGITPWLRHFVSNVRRDRVRYDGRRKRIMPTTP